MDERQPAASALPAAVLFDMDGLLVRTEPTWFEVEFSIAARLGCPWTEQDHHRLLGRELAWSAAYMTELAASDVGTDVVVGWLVDDMERRLRTDPVAFMPGARKLLTALANEGIRTALVSASFRRLVDAVLASMGEHPFAATVAGDEVRYGKPAPEPYERAARLLGAEPRSCVVLEDSPNGARAGLAAGAGTIVVPDPAAVTAVDIPTGATIVTSLAELNVATLRAFAATGDLRPVTVASQS
jgi:HAD superfamily hydrolase (TIGR01509 family)